MTLNCQVSSAPIGGQAVHVTLDEALARARLPRANGQLAVVAMSGGVDSAVTALLLREAGFRTVGINMRLFSPEQGHSRCCSIDDMEDARAVCERLGIPFYPLNMEREFQASVIDVFVDAYVAGETPNPCLECNRKPKFAFLLARANALGASYLATGHYARLESEGDDVILRRAVDEGKDQTYVLYSLRQAQLRRLLFPLGGLTKHEVRALAAHYELPVARKAESQDICFVPDGDYASFVNARRPGSSRPGDIVDTAGNIVGTHRGLLHYTVGQRKGLGLGGPEPRYVVALDAAANRLIVGNVDALAVRSVAVKRVSFIGDTHPRGPQPVLAMLRYRGAVTRATYYPDGADRAHLEFPDPPRSAARGQAVVWYDPEDPTRVLGGGTIASTTAASVSGAAKHRQLPVLVP